MNEEIAALLGDKKPADPPPSKKISRIPVKDVGEICNLSEGKKLEAIKSGIISWIKKYRKNVKTNIIKPENVILGEEVIFQQNSKDSCISVQKTGDKVTGLEYTCVCGKKERFVVE